MVTRNGLTSANPLGEGGHIGDCSDSFRELLDEATKIAFSRMLFVASYQNRDIKKSSAI